MGSKKRKSKDEGNKPNDSLAELKEVKIREGSNEEKIGETRSPPAREKKTAEEATFKKDMKKSKKKKKIKRSESLSDEKKKSVKEPKENSSMVAEPTPEPHINQDDSGTRATGEKRKSIGGVSEDDDHASDNEKTEQLPKRQPSPAHGVEEDSDSDDELLAAAAAWAQNRKDEEGNEATKSKNAKPGESQRKSAVVPPKPAKVDNSSKGQTKNLSLHITQLPFDANELDLRRLFAEVGCSITSIRLVYDKDERGRKTVFRGVAFVDVLDDGGTSYRAALALNRKAIIRGRKLNIRPTRSKQELADIVTRTRELVQEKIRRQQQEGNEDDAIGSEEILSKKQRKKQKQKEKKAKAKAKQAHKAKEHKTKHKLSQKDSSHNPGSGTSSENKKGKGVGKKAGEEDRKMTKKERNRRAAIIMGLKNRRK